MIYIIVFSVIAASLGLYYFLNKDLKFFIYYGIPHMKPLPLMGNMGPLIFRLQSGIDFIKNLYNLRPEAKYVGMYDLTKPLIVIRDPELIKSITIKHFDMFPDHHNFAEEFPDALFGKNLFSLRGERWHELRSILSPAFTSSKMKSMFVLMSKCAADFTDYLVQLPSEKQIMDTKDAFARYTNDVIATCAFGVSVDSMKNPKNQFFMYGKEATGFGSKELLKFYIFKNLPWLTRTFNLTFLRKEVGNFFQNLVRDTIETRDKNGIIRSDMLQLMMESRGKGGNGKELTIEDMTSQAFIFFFAGFDNTSTLMSFAAHEIAANQRIQERLQKEIDSVLKDTNGQAPYEAVNNMEYLDAVINETLRVYPAVVAMDRLCVEDFVLPPSLPGLNPFIIRKGQGVWIPLYGLHHDPKYFEEPEKFDPERFLGQRKKKTLGNGAYLPFGLGPRMCIGNRFALLETKVVLFHLLASCDLQFCEKTPIPMKIAKNAFNMAPEGGFWLNVLPRKSPLHTITMNSIRKL